VAVAGVNSTRCMPRCCHFLQIDSTLANTQRRSSSLAEATILDPGIFLLLYYWRKGMCRWATAIGLDA